MSIIARFFKVIDFITTMKTTTETTTKKTREKSKEILHGLIKYKLENFRVFRVFRGYFLY